MPDELPVPTTGAAPAAPAPIPQSAAAAPHAPGGIAYTGAPVPPPTVLASYLATEGGITLRQGNAASLAPRLAGATQLHTLTLTEIVDDIPIIDASLPASLIGIVFGPDCVGGDWPSVFIAALPDRSADDSGLYTDADGILSAAQLAALGAKGYLENV